MGNGDVKNARRCKTHVGIRGCRWRYDRRAALGNRWMIHPDTTLFRNWRADSGTNRTRKIATAKLHLERLVDLKGETIACREVSDTRFLLSKGISRAAKIKLGNQ